MDTDSREQGHDVESWRGFLNGHPRGIVGGGAKLLHKLKYWTIPLIVTALFVALAGNGMAQSAPTLGTAASFGVLGGSTVTNTGPTQVNGDLGVSPGTAVTGFPPGIVLPPGVIHSADAVAAQAQADVTTVYNNLAGQACDTILTGQDLGGLTLTSGVYCFSSSAQLTGDLTLDAEGDADALFIFQIGSTLTTASDSSVVFTNTNGEPICNVFWQIGSSATLGTTTDFAGNIVALTSITLNTGAEVNGRVLARNGAVTMDSNTISDCAESPLAVSLSYVSSERTGETVAFVWETATENGNAGFNLYMAVDGGMSLVTTEMVPSSVIDSLGPVGYNYTANVVGEQFYIEMVDISGERELHGPFALGEEYGTSDLSPDGPDVSTHRLFLPVISGR